MYSYPEYLNATQRIAIDLLTRAHEKDPVRFPYGPGFIDVTVIADSLTGTASVTWKVTPYGRLKVAINMPVKPADYVVTEQEFQHGVAYNLHEVGHPLHTDNVVWHHACETKRQVMLNYLEDVREEKATIDLGLAINATKIFSALIDSLHAKNIAQGYNPNDLRSIGWTLATLGRAANGYAIDVSDIYSRMDPNGPVFKICGWALPELKACTSTQECLDLADKVTAAIRAAQPKRQPQPPVQTNPQPEPDEETEEVIAGDDMDIDEVDTGDVDGEEGYAPKGVGEEPKKDEPKGDEGKAGEGGVTSLPDYDKEPPQPEPQPAADDLVDEVSMDPNTKESLTSTSRGFDAQRGLIKEVRKAMGRTLTDQPIIGRKVDWQGRNTVDVVTGDASKMGRQRALLAAALKREESDDYEGGRLNGRLDRRVLSRFATGNPHVFGKRTLAEGYDTDVQILVDGSGSMANARILAASTLALVVAQAAAQVGVQCTAHLFNSNGLYRLTKGRERPVGRKFAYAFNNARDFTPLTENLLLCAMEQKRRALHKRRVMFVITDGGCDMGPDVLKAAGQYVEGVIGNEIANIHIGRVPMGIFRNECAVDVRKVADTGVKTLTQVLERGAR